MYIPACCQPCAIHSDSSSCTAVLPPAAITSLPVHSTRITVDTTAFRVVDDTGSPPFSCSARSKLAFSSPNRHDSVRSPIRVPSMLTLVFPQLSPGFVCRTTAPTSGYVSWFAAFGTTMDPDTRYSDCDASSNRGVVIRSVFFSRGIRSCIHVKRYRSAMLSDRIPIRPGAAATASAISVSLVYIVTFGFTSTSSE
jgi:hypothetical protein